jgi:hypothetical protein
MVNSITNPGREGPLLQAGKRVYILVLINEKEEPS